MTGFTWLKKESRTLHTSLLNVFLSWHLLRRDKTSLRGHVCRFNHGNNNSVPQPPFAFICRTLAQSYSPRVGCRKNNLEFSFRLFILLNTENKLLNISNNHGMTYSLLFYSDKPNISDHANMLICPPGMMPLILSTMLLKFIHQTM